VIPEILLQAIPQTDEAKAVFGFEWASPEVGTRHKLGGTPDWLQQPEIPACSCGDVMSFYGQLDSIGDRVCLADCGIIYVFICFWCFGTKSVFQSA